MGMTQLDDAMWEMAAQVIRDASAQGIRLGTAESCTGGLVAGALTAVPGSSAVVRGGIVSYDPDVKHDVLGVHRAIIDDPALGVVSYDCAIEMCDGARKVLSCDVAVSVTGIAGPGGAEPGKPVGTVWFGLATPKHTRAECCCFAGDRAAVRERAVIHALELLREGIEELSNVALGD